MSQSMYVVFLILPTAEEDCAVGVWLPQRTILTSSSSYWKYLNFGPLR